MARTKHTITISAFLEPDEHPEEGQAWEQLNQRIRAVIAEMAAEPGLAVLDLTPEFSIDRSDG